MTLLLVNAAAMEALPIFLDRLLSPTMAILLSVTAVLFFGEPYPPFYQHGVQHTCTHVLFLLSCLHCRPPARLGMVCKEAPSRPSAPESLRSIGCILQGRSYRKLCAAGLACRSGLTQHGL